MTEEETIEMATLGEIDPLEGLNWDDLKGYVGHRLEDNITPNESYEVGEESPYALIAPRFYGDWVYTVYFKNKKALHDAVDLMKKEYEIPRADEVDDEQEDINKMSVEEFEDWKAQQAKLWEEGKAKRKLERDAQRRAWIEEHGSEQLKRILAEGDDYELLYLIEKGAKLFGKEYVIDYRKKIDWRSRQQPSREALEEADRLNKIKDVSVDVVWLPKGRCEAIRIDIEGVSFYKKMPQTVKPNIAKSTRTKMILFMKDGYPHNREELDKAVGSVYPVLYRLIERGWVYKNSTEHGSRYTLNLKNKEVLNFLGISDGDVKCNNCHSKNIVKWGKKQRAIGLRQVWKCKDCGHKFQTTGEGAEKNNISNKSVWNKETPIKWKCELCGNNAEWKLDMDDGKITYLCASDYDKIIEMAGDGGIEDLVAVTKLKSEIREKIETPEEQEIIETPIKWKCVVPDCKNDGAWELGATSEDAKKFWRDYMGFSLCAEHFEEFNHDDSDTERFQAFSRLKKRRL